MDASIVLVSLAALVNATYAIRKGHNVFVIFVGAAILMFFTVALNAVPGSEMGTAVAATFLLGSIIYRGRDILDMLTSLLNG